MDNRYSSTLDSVIPGMATSRYRDSWAMNAF
jgi:hypothetical protein